MDKEDIVKCFFKILKPNYTPKKKEVKKILNEGKKLLNNGWTISNITNRIVVAHQKKINPESLLEIPYFSDTPPLMKKDNILENKFYYHNLLHRTPDPPEISMSIEGKLNKKVNPFYLEITEYFSLEDLLEYMHEKFKIDDPNVYDRNKKIIKKYINDYKLDLILFTIDVTSKSMEDDEWNSKFAEVIVRNLGDGKKRYQNVKQNSSGEIIPYYKAYMRKEGLNG